MVIYISVAILVSIIAFLIHKKKRKKEVLAVPQGLQVFDERGNLTVDFTSRLTRILGTKSLPKGGNGEIVVPLQPGETLFAYLVLIDSSGYELSKLKVQGNKIIYEVEDGYDCIIVYGCFS